jgi:nitroreductase
MTRNKMDAIEAIKTRRSVTVYKDKEVEPEKLLTCLDAARWAPSAGNRQPWEFVVVTSDETRRKLAGVHPYARFVAKAPVALVFVANPSNSQVTHAIDTSLAAENFMLAAHALGLGTCWAGVYDTNLETPIKGVLGIPKELRVLCLMSVGYPSESPSKDRVPLNQLTHWEKYGQRERPR